MHTATNILSSESSTEYSETSLNTNSSLISSQNKTRNNAIFEIVSNLFSNIQIEPVFLLFSMGDSIVSMIVQTYYINRSCLITKGYDAHICQNLTNYPIIEKELEKDASQLSMYQMLIQSAFPILLSLFLGPLTDRYGYKPLMLYSILGYVLYISCMITTCFMTMLPPEYFLISSIPLGLSGGIVTLMISTYGYMATQTDESNRSYRLAALGAIWELGNVMGYICGSNIFTQGGFRAVFLYTLGFYTLSFLYALIFVNEKKSEEMELLGSNQSFSLCSLDPVKDIVHTALKSRPGHKRKEILIIVAATCLGYLAYASKLNQYLFTRSKFDWDPDTFSKFSALNTFLSGTGSCILTFIFMRLLKIRDVYILLVTGISNLSGYIIYATAQQPYQMYIASGVQIFGSITNPILKAILSKCVDKDEYGKVLSFVICIELSMPFIFGPLYNFVFIQTVNFFPGAIFILGAVFTAAVLVLVGVLHILSKNTMPYMMPSKTIPVQKIF